MAGFPDGVAELKRRPFRRLVGGHRGKPDHRDQAESGEKPRKDAGNEQGANGSLRQDAVDDEHDAGRNHDGQGTADADDGGGQFVAVAVAAHFRKRRRSHGRRRSGAAADQGREQDRGTDGRHGEAAPGMSDPGLAGNEGPPRHIPHGQKVGHEDEQWNGDENEPRRRVVVAALQNRERGMKAKLKGQSNRS